MAQDVNQEIAYFLRDAQYRVAELTVQMDSSEDDGEFLFQEKWECRERLITFMTMLFDSNHAIKSGMNLLAADPEYWTNRQILREIGILRADCKLNSIPYLTFTGVTMEFAQVVQQASAGGGVSFPVGTQGQFLQYDAAGNVVAASFPTVAGAESGDSINEYFSGRP